MVWVGWSWRMAAEMEWEGGGGAGREVVRLKGRRRASQAGGEGMREERVRMRGTSISSGGTR